MDTDKHSAAVGRNQSHTHPKPGGWTVSLNTENTEVTQSSAEKIVDAAFGPPMQQAVVHELQEIFAAHDDFKG